MRTFLLLSVVSLLAACGTPAGKCSTSNCTGCCDTTGQCQVGASNLTCGSGGTQCQPCANNQACTFGLCVTQSTSGGGGGGGAGGGSGGGAGGGGAVTCSPSNCAGCCDSTGRCQTGLTTATCGASGQACQQCLTAQTCNAGVCRNQTGGGGGATGGGTGGGGGTSSCSAATCPSGCCTASGVCITNTSAARCGASGNACTMCPAANTCVSGLCQPCAGCINVTTGACVAGTSNSICGRNGGFCQACDQTAGQTCNSGTCSGGTTCNASNCSGCCDGNSCVFASNYSNALCGQGASGAACVSCLGTQTCQGGVCAVPPSDGGVFDAGFGCVDSAECGSGECCDSLGVSLPGACISAGTLCQYGGANFFQCAILGSVCTCNGLTRACE